MPVETTTCWNCGGSGTVAKKDGLHKCGVCGGKGELRKVTPCGKPGKK